MDAEFISIYSPHRVSRERAQSWQWSQRRSKHRSHKSLNQPNVLPDFLQSLLKQNADHEHSSVVSDLPSLHGFKNPEGSLHSLNVKGRAGRAELLSILNDPLLNKGVLSERHSACSESSFGNSRKDQKRIFQIPMEPFRILDTPGIEDNYYSHLLTWSARNVIAISLSNTVYLFNYETSDFDEVYQADEDETITSLAFSPQGDYLAVANDQGMITIWDAATCQVERTLTDHLERVVCLDWHGQGLLSGSKDCSILVNDTRVQEGKPLGFVGHTQEIVGLKWDHDGRHFASGGNDNQALVWSLSGPTQEPLMRIKHKAAVRALGWSHKTRGLLATGGGYSDATIRTYDTARSALVGERETDGQVCSLLFSRLTNDLITSHGLQTNDISVWRTNGLKRVVQLMGHDIRPIHICLSPDGTTLISASADETLRFWKLFETEGAPRRPHPANSVKHRDSEELERHTSIQRNGTQWGDGFDDDHDGGLGCPHGSSIDERSDLDFPMDGPDSLEPDETY